jgi:hypothetical protein
MTVKAQMVFGSSAICGFRFMARFPLTYKKITFILAKQKRSICQTKPGNSR